MTRRSFFKALASIPTSIAGLAAVKSLETAEKGQEAGKLNATVFKTPSKDATMWIAGAETRARLERASKAMADLQIVHYNSWTYFAKGQTVYRMDDAGKWEMLPTFRALRA